MIDNIKQLPYPDIISWLYNSYYIRDITPTRRISLHWKEFGSLCNINIDSEGNLRKFKGSIFHNLKYSRLHNRLLNYICNFSYFIRLSHKKGLLSLIITALPVLKKMDVYFLYDCFRQICSLYEIRRYFDATGKFNILVIGDGFGFLSAFIKELYPNSKITLVDIGKVLLFQAVNLQKVHPARFHYLLNNDKENLEGIDFLYVTTENLWKIKNIKYKLIINIASMQEMDYEIIYDYFKFIRQNSTRDNLFYCCNRKSKVLIGGEVIEFLKYPWREEDKHFIDERPKFYRYRLTWKFPFVQYFDGPLHHRLTNMANI